MDWVHLGALGLVRSVLVMWSMGMSMLCKEEEAIEDFSRSCKFHKRLDSFGLPLEFKVP